MSKLDSLRTETPEPPQRLRYMWGPDGRQYGWEWSRDGFDHFADIYLLEQLNSGTDLSVSEPPRALDIGCGNGERIAGLLELGIFGQVYACDQNVQSFFQQAVDEVLGRLPQPAPKFVEKSVLDLSLGDFDGKPFDYINFRNVGHFLAPREFRAAIRNIRALAAANCLVTISFKGNETDKTDKMIHIGADIPGFYDYKLWDEECPAYTAIYSGSSVENFLERNGFLILKRTADLDCPLREDEYHIAALLSGNQVSDGKRDRHERGGLDERFKERRRLLTRAMG